MMQLFLQPEKSSLDALIFDLNFFSKLSGLMLNFGKCTIMRIGSFRGTDFRLQCQAATKWCNGSVDVLGINIPDNPKELVR